MCGQSIILASFFACLIWLVPVRAEETVATLEDFDGAVKLSRRWTAVGDIGVERKRVEDDVPLAGVAGHVVRCTVARGATLAVKDGFPRPDYEKFDKIRFRIRAEDASRENPSAFEFRAFSAARRASLWRKFSVQSNEWQVIDLPMEFFRYSSGANLGWDEVSRFGVRFRNAGTVSFDGFELVADDDGSPRLTVEQLARFAFGDDSEDGGDGDGDNGDAMIERDKRFAVITNDPRVNAKQAIAEFNKLFDLVYADFPELPKPTALVPTLIFANEREYREFWPKFGAAFEAKVPPVTSSGYSLLGVAGSSYSDEYGPVRPVLVHETCHALLGRPLGVSNSSEWLHEGLANYYQLNWTRQNVFELVRRRVESGNLIPLRKLTNGERVPIRNYAQVTLFVKWMLADDDRKSRFTAAMKDMRKRCSTALPPICERHFGKTIEDLEREWVKWLKSNLDVE